MVSDLGTDRIYVYKLTKTKELYRRLNRHLCNSLRVQDHDALTSIRMAG